MSGRLSNDRALADLRIACTTGDVETVSLLIKNHPETCLRQNAHNDKGPLRKAIEKGNTQVVKILLEAFGAQFFSDYSLVETAAEYERLEILQDLIKHGANCYFGDPVLWAVQNKNTEIVRLLLENGAKPNPQLLDVTTLNMAAENGYLEIVNLLIQHRANVNSQSQNTSTTALMRAAANGRLEIVNLLIQSGAKVNLRNYSGFTALIEAARNGHFEIVKVLINNGANVNSQDYYQRSTALIEAARNGHLEIVQHLIEHGADINIQDQYGTTALIEAAKSERLEIVQHLIEHRADINIQDEYGTTALICAAHSCNKKNVEALIAAGADVHLKMTTGETALSVAIASKNLEIVQLLVDNGCAMPPAETEAKKSSLKTRHKKIALLLKMAWSGRTDGLGREEQATIERHLESTGRMASWTRPNSLKCFNALTQCFAIVSPCSPSELQKSLKSAVTMFDKVLSNSGLNDAEKKAARMSFGEALTQLPESSR